VTDPGTTVRQRRWLWSVLPRFEETLQPEHYRFTGKIRALVCAALITITLLVAAQIEDLENNTAVYWNLFPFHLVTHVADMLLGLWIWKGRLSTAGMRRATYACVFIEALTTVVTAWVYGTLTSHMVGFGFVLVLVYRLAFDFRTGAAAFLMILAGLWAVVIAEVSGWLPPQPIAPGPVDHIYQIDEREFRAMFFMTILLGLTFVLANWTVARLRFKELTIRLLREQLHAADAGRVGRHSGRTLSDTYAVGAVLGAGGMGEVYDGEHRRTRRRVAIKLLHPHLVEDPQILARFRREAEAIGRLGSEHIVEIVDVGEDDGQPFLVLEYLDGESLAAKLATGPLDWKTLDEVIRQLALGLDAAHRAGVVHRDLKPANVFLARRDDGSLLVKILDFGVSKVRDNATAITREIAILGTPDYMSPEQAVGLADAIDERSDVFAVGAIVYAAATGRAPFEATSVPAQLRRICDEEPVPVEELRPDAPPGLAAVIAIALAKRPEERYARSGELAADLATVIAGGDVSAIVARAAKVQRGKPASRSGADVRVRRDDAVAMAHTHTG
jgi:tRNA A-37 threonylcarbamoyl transferase component Bud32